METFINIYQCYRYKKFLKRIYWVQCLDKCLKITLLRHRFYPGKTNTSFRVPKCHCQKPPFWRRKTLNNSEPEVIYRPTNLPRVTSSMDAPINTQNIVFVDF